MSSSLLAAAFDHAEALPSGHQVVEASAGTGKTYALVGLATRFLADGRCTASQLLVVTFSRSATRELRSRLLERLAGTADLLAGVVDGRPAPARPDPVQAALLDGDRAALALRADRLATALADIDHATITTIHSLCDDLLRRLGDHRLGTLLDDDGGLAEEVLGDLYLRIVRAHPDRADALPRLAKGLATVRAGMHTDPAALVPERSMDHQMGIRVWIAHAAAQEAAARKAAGRLHTYDDLLGLLDQRLAGEEGGEVLAAALRTRFTVGLVDEFQDTDPVQWRILRRLFDDPAGRDGRALVLVGDPKQAIYGFRGADIATYLQARGERPDRTLVSNHRADGPVVEAVTSLFTGMPMGEGIGVHAITPVHPVRLSPPPPAPVAIRLVTDDAPVPSTRRGPRVGGMRTLIAADVAAHVVDLASTPADVLLGGGGTRPLGIADIAVLVRTNAQAALVRRQLLARGVPTVLNGVGNVLDTPAARDWLALLRALAQPTDGSGARLAAMTDLIGWSVAEVAEADADAMEDLHVLLHDLAEVAATAGLASLLRHVDHATGMSPRLRRQPGGDRRLADLLHVAEVLNAEARRSAVGLAGLISWLESAIATAVDPPPPHLARRLERSGDALEILTIHGAKGLERGIVLIPFLWDTGRPPDDILVYVDPVTGERRVDVGGDWFRDAPRQASQQRAQRKLLADQQAEQEEMRLAYVAATRARHHVVLWWGGAGDHAAALQAEHPEWFTVTPIDTAPSERPLDQTAPPTALPVLGRLGRTIDHGWRRHSYSALIARGEEDAVHRGLAAGAADTSGPDTPGPDTPRPDTSGPGAPGPDTPGPDTPGPDTPRPDTPGPGAPGPGAPRPDAPPDDPALLAEVPLADMPGGAEVGSLVHAVLEDLDFTAPDAEARIGRLLAARGRGASVDLTDPRIAEGLVRALDTPLGPGVGDVALRDITRADRIDEMAFELPALVGTAADTEGALRMGDLADVLDAHVPTGDPMHGYGEVLRHTHAHIEVRGFLAGFIDLLVRVPGVDGGPSRYLVADYKTNVLTPPGEDVLRVGHHSAEAMAAAMWHHHYPVQALFYLVAAHRYLRWRVPGYAPETHLAGAGYLFLRGMVGRDTPRQPDGTPFGVLRWNPPTSLLLAVDALLVGGPGREGAP